MSESIVERQVAKLIVDLLNGAAKLDRMAVTQLLTQRVACNVDLADHPTIQVGGGDDGYYHVSTLGLLNGLAGTWDNKGAPCGRVAVTFSVQCPDHRGYHQPDGSVVGDACSSQYDDGTPCSRKLVIGEFEKAEVISP